MADDCHGARAPQEVAMSGTADRLRRALISDLDTGFAEVMREHAGIVYSVARGMTVNAADAEDLTSEAFLRAYRALRGYEPARIAELALRPWLLTIVRNTARNAARYAARRPAPPPRQEPTEDGTDSTDAADPAKRAEQEEVQRTLGALLAGLPEAQRTAVVLRHALGLSIAETAHVLGVKDGTAKSHISRGLRRLRALLTDATPAGPVLCETDVFSRAGPSADGATEHRVLVSGRRRR
jgi:RNA polymerase sigma factor (sigma-70 family)